MKSEDIVKFSRFRQFIENLKSCILSDYAKIEHVFNAEYGYPELDPVRDEICKCIICGFHQAAITLTNHLLEQSLKTCLIYKHSIVNKQSKAKFFDCFNDSIKEYDNINLSKSIDNAYSVGLITKEQKTLLHEFRERFRNAYSHASLEKTFGETAIRGKMISIDDFNNIEELFEIAFDRNKDQDIELKTFPITRGFAQCKFAEQDSVPYFMAVDKIIREMLTKIGI